MARPSASLLELVQGLIERTYRLESGVDNVGRFVIGDAGYTRLYSNDRLVRRAGSGDGSGSKTLVRQTPRGLRACIYYPDQLIDHLERFPPLRGVGDENVDAFATLVEELDHLLVIAERARQQRTVSLFELELHANVSKYLVLSRFVAGTQGRLEEPRRLWLRHQLFDKGSYVDENPRVQRRYREAARWAVKFLDGLATLPPRWRLERLRVFHRASATRKIELIRDLAA